MLACHAALSQRRAAVVVVVVVVKLILAEACSIFIDIPSFYCYVDGYGCCYENNNYWRVSVIRTGTDAFTVMARLEWCHASLYPILPNPL